MSQAVYYVRCTDNDLTHYGVLGMKWGVRRYQNKDGTLTKAGKKHKEKALEETRRSKEYEKRFAKKREPYLDKDEVDRLYISSYKYYKLAELTEKAINNNTLQVGADYIINKKYGSIKYTETGEQKLKKLESKAETIAEKESTRIYNKYVKENKRIKTEIEDSHNKAFETTQKIRDDIKKKSFKSEEERNSYIDKVFQEAMSKADSSGDYIQGDELQNQWALIYDDIEAERF